MVSNKSTQDINSFTRTLWWIAGATPQLLENYPSEYAKFSAIGMTILMTCLVAFVSGMAAAWYFSSNVFATIVFGIFWAFMIFCIDRALVVTMKKTVNPKSFKKKLIEALKIIIPRAVLAILVSLLMSIPLELIVFEDLINTEVSNYQSKKLENSSKIGYDAVIKSEAQEREKRLIKQNDNAQRNLVYAEKEFNSALNTVKELEFQITSKRSQIDKPNTPRYKSAVSELQKSKADLNSTNISDVQRSMLKTKISSNQSIINEEKKNWNKKINEEINELLPKLEKAEKEKSEKNAELTNVQKASIDIGKMISNVQNVISNADSNIEDKVGAIDSLQKTTNKFILHYSVLEYAVHDKIVEKIPLPIVTQNNNKESQNQNPSNKEESITQESPIIDNMAYEEIWKYRNPEALMMLWLIRILFFVFEMMPTVVKAVSKPGPYERECEAQDEQMAQFFTSTSYRDHMQIMLNAKLQHEKQLAEDRREAEKSLHDDILSKVKDAQKDVALDAINRWRASQMNVSGQVHSSDFYQNNSTQSVRVEQVQKNNNNNSQIPTSYNDEFD